MCLMLCGLLEWQYVCARQLVVNCCMTSVVHLELCGTSNQLKIKNIYVFFNLTAITLAFFN